MKYIVLLILIFNCSSSLARKKGLVDRFTKNMKEVTAGPAIRQCSSNEWNARVGRVGSSAYIDLDMYKRDLDGPTFAILCLNVGLAVTPGLIGHSTITTFFVDSDNERVARKKESYGFWPDINLQKDYKEDHFLHFKNGHYAPSETLCLRITKNDYQKMSSYIDSRKDDVWTYKDNCNDVSAEAFDIATGVKFDPKKLRTLNFAHPANLLKDVKKQIEKREVRDGSFRYYTDDKKEIDDLISYSINPRSGEPEVTKEDIFKERRKKASRRSRGAGGPTKK